MSATIDQITISICDIVRAAHGMPAGSVRPAHQRAPVGVETSEIAIVNVMNADDLGEPGITYEVSGGDTDEVLQLPRQIVASVQFFKSPTPDALGRARHSDAAFTRAARLPLLLGLTANLARMRAAGLGYLRASQARNLIAIADAGWESRGSIDITFNVIAREAARIDTIGIVPLNIITQNPDQTRSSEVIAP